MTRNVVTKKTLLMLLCVLVFVAAFCAMPGKTVHAAEPSIKSKIKDNKQFDLTNKYMKSWLKHYYYKSIGKADWWGLIPQKSEKKSYPAQVRLKWKTKGIKAKKYVVRVSTDPQMKKAKKYIADKKYIDIDNLMTGQQYFWQVYVKGKKSVTTPINKFKTKEGFRTIRMPGVSNVRDLGGKKVPGGVVKQGMLFRSGRMDKDNIKPEAIKIANKDLKIKTEFDLRKPGTTIGEEATGSSSVLGSKVKYITLKGTGATQFPYLFRHLFPSFWPDAKIPDPELNKNLIAQEIRVLANKNYYPIVFHCKIGRDRTGTLAFIVGGLLGEDRLDLFKDYEMSYYSGDGCEHGTATTQSISARPKVIYNEINKYGRGKDSFSKRVELFLRDCGVSKKDINKVKRNLIEYDD